MLLLVIMTNTSHDSEEAKHMVGLQFEEWRKKHPQPDIRMMSTSESAMPGEYSFTLTFMFWNPRYEPRIPIL